MIRVGAAWTSGSDIPAAFVELVGVLTLVDRSASRFLHWLQ